MDVFVTGIGIVSAIGLNTKENLTNLINQQTGISKNQTFHELTGAVKLNNKQLAKEQNIETSEYSRSSLMAIKAAKEAIQHLDSKLKSSLAFISSTSVGGIDKTEKKYFDMLTNTSTSMVDKNLTYENGKTTEDIAKILGISGYINTISTACSSGANAIMLGARLIKSGMFDRVLVGGTDPLAQLNLSGFRSLGVYDNNLCKPFDKNRKGLNLGEGAAYLLLENKGSMAQTKSKALGKITGYANTADAYHQTASSEDGKGATLAMNKALTMAELNTNEINYINTHGTGTSNNDASESAALVNVFGNKVPTFSSTKCYTGHTLAAAGAIEAVYSILAIQNNCIFPTFTFETPMDAIALKPQKKVLPNTKVQHVLSNSFGFGGNCTSLIFSKV